MVKSLKICFLGSVSSLLVAGTAVAGNYSMPAYTPDLVPANPNTGECYMRVPIEAQFSETPKTVLVQDGYQKIDVTQPQLATRQENILVKEASVRYQVRQPTYRSVAEQVMVRPSYDKLSVSDPTFKTVVEKVQVSEPRLVWKLGNPAKLRAQGYKIRSTADGGRLGQGYSSTTQFAAEGGTKCGPMCEIWCLVEEPAKSVAFKRKVLANPGTVRRTPVPAQYQTITKQVVSDPGGVQEIPVPAEYRSINVQDLVNPGGEKYVNVPAKYGNIATQSLISPERYEWRRVMCATGTVVPSSSASRSSGYSSHSYGGSHGATSHSSSTQGTTYGGGSTGYISSSTGTVPHNTYGGSQGYSSNSYSTGTYSSGTYSSGYQSGQTRPYSDTGYNYQDEQGSSGSTSSHENKRAPHHRSPNRTRR